MWTCSCTTFASTHRRGDGGSSHAPASCSPSRPTHIFDEDEDRQAGVCAGRGDGARRSTRAQSVARSRRASSSPPLPPRRRGHHAPTWWRARPCSTLSPSACTWPRRSSSSTRCLTSNCSVPRCAPRVWFTAPCPRRWTSWTGSIARRTRDGHGQAIRAFKFGTSRCGAPRHAGVVAPVTPPALLLVESRSRFRHILSLADSMVVQVARGRSIWCTCCYTIPYVSLHDATFRKLPRTSMSNCAASWTDPRKRTKSNGMRVSTPFRRMFVHRAHRGVGDSETRCVLLFEPEPPLCVGPHVAVVSSSTPLSSPLLPFHCATRRRSLLLRPLPLATRRRSLLSSRPLPSPS